MLTGAPEGERAGKGAGGILRQARADQASLSRPWQAGLWPQGMAELTKPNPLNVAIRHQSGLALLPNGNFM